MKVRIVKTTRRPLAVPFLKLALTIVLSLFSVAVTPTNAQQAPTIAAIEFVGLEQLKAEELIAMSGLRVGQPFDEAALNAAAQKLADSGLLKEIGYRTKRDGNAITIRFEVEESKKANAPVVFDNFIWFTEEQLIAAIRREAPTFDGTAPSAGEMTNSITAALQKLLKEHNLEGTVEYLPSQNARITENVFSVADIKMPVCTLHFPGAQAVPETTLVKSSQELTNNNYSRQFSSLFPKGTLSGLYREIGMLRVEFGRPLAKPDPNCKGGVDLTIPVAEGAVYSWAKPDWSNNQALTAQQLEAALGMKAGEVANGLKFDKGLIDVRKAYGRNGYLDARLTSQPEFDDGAKRVTYKIAVTEGPQYRMGNLVVKGYSPAAEKLLREKWALKTGEVYDDGYLSKFMLSSMREVVQQVGSEYSSFGRQLPKFATETNPNKDTLMVDVVFEIKN